MGHAKIRQTTVLTFHKLEIGHKSFYQGNARLKGFESGVERLQSRHLTRENNFTFELWVISVQALDKFLKIVYNCVYYLDIFPKYDVTSPRSLVTHGRRLSCSYRKLEAGPEPPAQEQLHPTLEANR